MIEIDNQYLKDTEPGELRPPSIVFLVGSLMIIYKQKYKMYKCTNTISGIILLLSFLLVKALIAANPIDDLKIQIQNTKIQNTEIPKNIYKYNLRDESLAVFPPREGSNCCKPS